MVENSTERFSKMGRRRFLKALSALGVSAGAFNYVSKDALAAVTDNPEKEVPRLESFRHTNHEEVTRGAKPEREPVFYTISREKWTIVESAHDARERLEEKVRRRYETSLQVSVRDRKNGRGKELVVYVPKPGTRSAGNTVSVEDVRETLPTEMTGVAGRKSNYSVEVSDIPIRVRASSEEYQAYYDYEYRPVPAGSLWRMVWGASEYCTVGTPVYDNSKSEERLVTAAHCFVNNDTNTFYQNDSSSTTADGVLARKKFNEGGFDAAVVEPQTFDTKYDFAEEGCSCYQGIAINGTLSKTYIKDLQGTDGKLTFQGARTGTSLGNVVEVSGNMFATNHQTNTGDSGGPAHRTRTGSFSTYSEIGGVLSYKDGNTGNRWYTFMADIESDLNVTV